MPKTFLLTDEFPPLQTGVSRLMGEIARRYPKGELLVSTGQHRDSLEMDCRFPGATIDRLPVPARSLRNLAGLLFWSRRVAALARQCKPRFTWCNSVRPSSYAAKWAHERVGSKYGVLVHGGDLLYELHKLNHSPLARRTAPGVVCRDDRAVAIQHHDLGRQRLHLHLLELRAAHLAGPSIRACTPAPAR